jgi:hypothetical protein
MLSLFFQYYLHLKRGCLYSLQAYTFSSQNARLLQADALHLQQDARHLLRDAFIASRDGKIAQRGLYIPLRDARLSSRG